MAIRAWPGPYPPLGVPFVLNRASPQAVGLVGWWPTVNGAAGATLPDLAGRGGALAFDGTNDPGWSPAPVLGRALSWSTTNKYISGSSTVANFTRTTPFTVAFWLYYSDGATTNRQIIMGNLTSSAITGWFVDLFSSSANDFRFVLRGTGGQSIDRSTTTNALVAGAWNHIVVSHDGSSALSGLKFILNGFDNATSFAPIDNLTSSDTRSGLPFRVGRSGDLTTITAKSGTMIADLRLYDRALSAAGAFALYAPQTRWQLYSVPVARRGPAPSTIFRRTLSQQGARIGSRQVAA